MKQKHYAAIILSGVLIWMSCQEVQQPKSIAAFEPVQVTNNGVHIDYTDEGNGDTTLVFVHGWCINKTYWSGQVQYFKNHYRVITMDLPGYGRSGKNRNDWTVEAFGADVDSLLSQLNIHNAILIGHSMAGHIVLQAALHAPDRVLGLIGIDNFNTVGQTETAEDRKNYTAAIETMQHHFKETVLPSVNEQLFSKSTPDSVKKRVLGDVSASDTVIAVASMQPDSFNEVESLVHSKKKLNLVNSDVHPTDTTGFIKNHIPYGIYFIQGSGHYPMIEQPQAFNAALQQAIWHI